MMHKGRPFYGGTKRDASQKFKAEKDKNPQSTSE